MLIKRTKERSPEITPDNRGVICGKELNGMATDEELYGQYLSGDEKIGRASCRERVSSPV